MQLLTSSLSTEVQNDEENEEGHKSLSSASQLLGSSSRWHPIPGSSKVGDGSHKVNCTSLHFSPEKRNKAQRAAGESKAGEDSPASHVIRQEWRGVGDHKQMIVCACICFICMCLCVSVYV